MVNTSSHLKRQPKGQALQNTMTPPMTFRSRSSSISSFDDEAYFSKTYVPLSSLPTPPSSSFSRQQTPESPFFEDTMPDSELLGPAIHLTNLIPVSTSLATPSVPVVHAILTRADLPLEIVAMAVCILDSLNSRFALQWRKSCPLVKTVFKSTWADDETVKEQHIDSIQPELIVLSALVLAVKFLDDYHQSTREYAADWGKRLWTCEQINYTQRCLLENVGYKLLPLWEESYINGALEDMERAAKQSRKTVVHSNSAGWGSESFGVFDEEEKPISPGHAVKGMAQMLTPAETPMPGNVKGTKEVEEETKSAFRMGRGDEFQLLERTKVQTEPFPEYDDSELDVEGHGCCMGV